MAFDLDKWMNRNYPGPKAQDQPPQSQLAKAAEIAKHARKHPLQPKPTDDAAAPAAA